MSERRAGEATCGNRHGAPKEGRGDLIRLRVVGQCWAHTSYTWYSCAAVHVVTGRSERKLLWGGRPFSLMPWRQPERVHCINSTTVTSGAVSDSDIKRSAQEPSDGVDEVCSEVLLGATCRKGTYRRSCGWFRPHMHTSACACADAFRHGIPKGRRTEIFTTVHLGDNRGLWASNALSVDILARLVTKSCRALGLQRVHEGSWNSLSRSSNFTDLLGCLLFHQRASMKIGGLRTQFSDRACGIVATQAILIATASPSAPLEGQEASERSDMGETNCRQPRC